MAAKGQPGEQTFLRIKGQACYVNSFLHKHIFVCLLGIHVFSLVKYLLKYFALFELGCVIMEL